MKNTTRTIVFLCASVFAGSVSSSMETDQLTTYFDGTKVVAEKLATWKAEKSPQHNTLISPVGPSLILQTVHQSLNVEGVQNDSIIQKEIEGLLGHAIAADDIKKFNSAIPTDCIESKFTFLNHQYILPADKGVDQDAVAQLADFGSSAVYPLNFEDSQGAADAINAMVERDTQGHIQNLVEPSQFNGNTMAVFLSTLYIKANWLKKFKETQILFGPNGDKKSVKGLVADQKVYFGETETHFLVTIQAANKVLLLLKMSKQGDDVSPVTAADFDACEQGKLIALTIPEFTIENTVNLTELFQDKLPNLFGVDAEFQTTLTSEPLHISAFLQKNKLSVTKNGLEGSSATMGGFAKRSLPPKPSMELIFDKPFSFLLSVGLGKDQATGGSKDFLHLFAGNLLDPEKK